MEPLSAKELAMRSAYRNPLIWCVVFVGVVFAIIGQVLNMTITSDWKYLFSTVRPTGIFLVMFFTFCAFANYIGTRFVVDKPFTTQLPSMMIVWFAIFSVVALFIAMPLGIESRLAVWLIFLAAGSMLIGVPAAFFIRGMAVPTEFDR